MKADYASGVTFSRRGEVLLAPLYDAAPTLLLYARSSNVGHSVAGQARLNYITLDHLVREGVTRGWTRERPALA